MGIRGTLMSVSVEHPVGRVSREGNALGLSKEGFMGCVNTLVLWLRFWV